MKITMEAGVCPWNADHRLVRIGLKAREIPTDKLPESNLVFLIDVSGSMWGPTRLDLVKSSLKLLVNNLREKDKVAIVVYAGNASVKLESTPGSDKQKIRDAIDELTSGGSTAGGAGIQLAYKVAKQNFLPKGNNRIILCSDGDFNVGVSMKDVQRGPSVTRYEVQPNAGVKVSKITGLSDDIALNLSAQSIRIEAPVPG